MLFFQLKMAHILLHLEQFSTVLHDHPSYVHAKYHWDLCNNEDGRAWTKIRAHILDPAVVVASMLSELRENTRHASGPVGLNIA